MDQCMKCFNALFKLRFGKDIARFVTCYWGNPKTRKGHGILGPYHTANRRFRHAGQENFQARYSHFTPISLEPPHEREKFLVIDDTRHGDSHEKGQGGRERESTVLVGQGVTTTGFHGFPVGIPWQFQLPKCLDTSSRLPSKCCLCAKRQGYSANHGHRFMEVAGGVARALGPSSMY